MTALTNARSTNNTAGGDPVPKQYTAGLKANKKAYQGGILVINPANGGYAEPGSTAVGLIALGRIEAPLFGSTPAVTQPGTGSNYYDNTGGTDGGITVTYRQGVFTFGNSASADLIAATNIGQDCFIVDDQTVALTDAQGTRSRAGTIMGVDSAGGVQVQMGPSFQGPKPISPRLVITVPVTLANLVVGGGTIANLGALGFAGRILSLTYVPMVTGTGAGATMACSCQIAGVATTGGVCTPTLANAVYAAAPVPGTAITGANTFTAAQAITIVNAAGTVFTAGSGAFIVQLG